MLADRVLAPLSGFGAGNEVDADPRFRMLRTIVGSKSQDCSSSAVSNVNALGLESAVRNLVELVNK